MKNIVNLMAVMAMMVIAADSSAGTPTSERFEGLHLTMPVAAPAEQTLEQSVNPGNQGEEGYKAQPTPESLPVSHEPVQFIRPLAHDRDMHLLMAPGELKSKSYYKVVSGKELSQGVSLDADAPGAIVRVTTAPSPRGAVEQKSAPVLEPGDFILESSSGKVSTMDDRAAVSAKSRDLSRLHPELFSRTSAFKVPEVLGAGRLTLRAARQLPDNAKYTIHVFDKQSERELRSSPEKSNLVPGEQVRVSGTITGAALDELKAVWKAPDGREFPARIRLSRGNSWTLSTKAPDVRLRPGELLSLALAARAQGPNGTVLRYLEVPVRVFSKTAGLTGQVQQRSMPRATVLEYGVQVEKAGRYEIRALVFGKDRSGQWKPAAMLFSANYLQPGTGALSVRLSAADLAKSGLSAPFAVREVQLVDQGQIAILEAGERFSEIRFEQPRRLQRMIR
jgi:hypothetical protein